MNIKDIILKGGKVSFSYKELIEDNLMEAYIIQFNGSCGMDSNIYVCVPTKGGRKYFNNNEIDDAISMFTDLVFCEKNIFNGFHETIVELTEEGYDLNLDDDSDLEIVTNRLKSKSNV